MYRGSDKMHFIFAWEKKVASKSIFNYIIFCFYLELEITAPNGVREN